MDDISGGAVEGDGDDVETSVSECTSVESDIHASAPPNKSLHETPRATVGGPRKRKQQSTAASDSEQSAAESFVAMQQYFEAKKAMFAGPKTQQTEDTETVFGNLIACELRKISSLQVKAELKKTIMSAIYDAQAKDASTNTVTQLFQVNADGTLAELTANSVLGDGN